MNDGNLIPITHLSSEEAKKRGSAGGKKSGEARRRKRDLKAAMNELLNMDIVSPDILDNTTEMGITSSLDYNAAIVAALVRKAAGGDVAAFKEIRSLIGKDNDTERLKLQKRELAIKEKKTGDSAAPTDDDGFIEALKGSAAKDWGVTEDDN